MIVAVVGHVEWVEFVRVVELPARGAIIRASEAWDEPAGGGAVAAVELAHLAGACTLYTRVGGDALGARVAPALAEHRVIVRAITGREPQRRAITLLDASGERTIIVVGEAPAPAGADPIGLNDLAHADAVYFCKGDAAALRAARRARVLVATARVLPVLKEAGVTLDALVHSARDDGERYRDGDLVPPPRLVATTEGAEGGRYRTSNGSEGRWAAAPLPGEPRDAYGAGDCFAAALAHGLALGLPDARALDHAATRAAAALCRTGALGQVDRRHDKARPGTIGNQND